MKYEHKAVYFGVHDRLQDILNVHGDWQLHSVSTGMVIFTRKKPVTRAKKNREATPGGSK